jgi:4-alpha-glucanotransferase
LDDFVDRHGPVWLQDFALFTALKRAHRLEPWWRWEEGLRLRRPGDLANARTHLASSISAVLIEQYLFDRQFGRLRRHAAARGVKLIGDLPIFVAHDSADVWAHPDLFRLDERGLPTVVAGVPPDYFSATGQRWGNPVYAWERHERDGFSWWKARMRRSLELFDLVRIDHFRGFSAAWHIPANEETAVVGEWVPAPGIELFDALTDSLGAMPVIAEDLGVITAEVVAMRDRYGFPGMKVLQFGFGSESAHAIDRFRTNVVAYTGTHDNDTAVGWWRDPGQGRAPERALARTQLGLERTEGGFARALITALFESIADTVIVPLQDILELGSEARMNTPGVAAGNWRWRFTSEEIDDDRVRWLRTLANRTGRGD